MADLEKKKEIFELFDGIKSKLNEILINGISNINKETEKELKKFKDQLEDMHLTTISGILNGFLSKTSNIKANQTNQEVKKIIASNALKIISFSRIFERIMNLEIIKSQLIDEIGEDAS